MDNKANNESTAFDGKKRRIGETSSSNVLILLNLLSFCFITSIHFLKSNLIE